jgi:hypothetical protein
METPQGCCTKKYNIGGEPAEVKCCATCVTHEELYDECFEIAMSEREESYEDSATDNVVI